VSIMSDLLVPEDGPVMAIARRNTNAELIRDVHRLGYIRDEDLVLDATVGSGIWWKEYRPERLVTNNLLSGSPDLRFDFRCAPFADNTFNVVAFDPDYRLNGTPDRGDFDDRYGINVKKRWQERYKDIEDGLLELSRVTKKKGFLLLKCQDMVSSGAVRWQTIDFTNYATKFCGMKLEDWLIYPGTSNQNEARGQKHARRNYSSLLIFKKK